MIPIASGPIISPMGLRTSFQPYAVQPAEIELRRTALPWVYALTQSHALLSLMIVDHFNVAGVPFDTAKDSDGRAGGLIVKDVFGTFLARPKGLYIPYS